MASWFDPKPGGEVEISRDELRYNANRAQAWDLKGFIRVTPPKGTCLFIRTARRREDLKVCESQNVSFTVRDLSLYGQLKWRVFKDAAQDFGIDITWESRYLFGKAVRHGSAWPGPSLPVLVDRCEIIVEPNRRVRLHLFGGQTWTVTFPKEDVLVGQPRENANLNYVNTSGDVKETSADISAEEEGDGEGEGEGKPVSGIKLQINQLMKKKEYKWQGFHRFTYEMESSRFHSVSSNTPGMDGLCRYKTRSWRTLPDVGLLECHNVDQFRWLYLPLRCLADLPIYEKKSETSK